MIHKLRYISQHYLLPVADKDTLTEEGGMATDEGENELIEDLIKFREKHLAKDTTGNGGENSRKDRSKLGLSCAKLRLSWYELINCS